MLEAGKAVITLKLEDTEAYRAMERFQDRFQRALRNVGLAAVGAGATITAALTAAASKAEADSIRFRSVEAVFGEATEQAVSLSKAISDQVGASLKSVQSSVISIALLGQKFDLAQNEAATFGAEVTRLGADLESYFGLSAGQGLEKIRDAIAGNSSALAEFGIQLTRDAVAAELAAMGISNTVETATSLQLAMARGSLVARAFADSGISGSAASDQYAVSLGRLLQSFDSLTGAVGRAMQPIFDFAKNAAAQFMDAVSSMVGGLAEMIESCPLLTQIVGSLGIAVTGVGAALLGLVSSVTVAAASVAGLSVTALATVGAVVAVGAGLYFLHQKTGAFQPILDTLSKAAGYFASAWSESVVPALQEVGSLISGSLSAVFAAFGDTLQTCMPIISAVGSVMMKVFSAVGNFLKETFLATVETLTGAVALLFEKIGQAAAALSRLLGLQQKSKGGNSGGSSSGEAGPNAFEAVAKGHAADLETTEEMRQKSGAAKESLKTPEQKYQEYMAEVESWLARGLVNEKELGQLREKAIKEREDAIRQAYEQSEEGIAAKEQKQKQEAAAKSLSQFGDQIRRETMTLEEQVAAKIAKINEAVASDATLKEAGDKAIAAAKKEIEDAQKKAADEERSELLGKITKSSSTRMTVARAQGGEAGKNAEMLEQKSLVDSLKSKGFTDEARDAEIQYLGQVVQRSQSAMDEADRMRGQGAMVTSSVSQAMSGLGSNGTIGEQQLKAAEDARAVMEECRRLLQEIADSTKELRD